MVIALVLPPPAAAPDARESRRGGRSRSSPELAPGQRVQVRQRVDRAVRRPRPDRPRRVPVRAGGRRSTPRRRISISRAGRAAGHRFPDSDGVGTRHPHVRVGEGRSSSDTPARRCERWRRSPRRRTAHAGDGLDGLGTSVRLVRVAAAERLARNGPGSSVARASHSASSPMPRCHVRLRREALIRSPSCRGMAVSARRCQRPAAWRSPPNRAIAGGRASVGAGLTWCTAWPGISRPNPSSRASWIGCGSSCATRSSRWRRSTSITTTFRPIAAPLMADGQGPRLWAAHLGPELGGQGFGQVKLGLMHEILGGCEYRARRSSATRPRTPATRS